MAGLSHLRDVYDKRGKDFLEGLLNKSVIVNEKMDGAFFGAQKNEEGKFRFFKRNTEITYVDRVLSRYYEPAIRHFENLRSDVVEQIPTNYYFGMEWFTSPKAQTIAYDRLPKNGLILSYIHVLDENGKVSETLQDKETLNKWADLLDIERPPIVFQGKLSDEQREQILDFAYSPLENLVQRFKTKSFTRYIMSVLNPEMKTTFLRDAVDKEIEGLVFRFYDPTESSEDSVFLAKLVDPIFQERAKQKAHERIQKKSDDYIWIIVIDLMNFIERYSVSELREIELAGSTQEERYISLINKIYSDFIGEFGKKYADLDIQIPEFLTREEFGVNFDLVKNDKVTKLIESNTNFKEIYRILLNIFRKKKVKVSSTLFTKQMKDNLNAQIDKINRVIMGDSIFENYFPTFSEFVGTDSEPGYFETFAQVPDDERRVKRANLIVSDFQPIHAGHLKFAQRLTEETSVPCVFICINDGSVSKARPIKLATLESCLSKLVGQNSNVILGYKVVAEGEIERLLEAVKPEFEPISIAATKSRVKDLALQMELAKKRSRNLNFKKDFKLKEMPTQLDKEELLSSIRNGNYSSFKALAPSAIHSEFFNLNKDVSESLNEALVAEPVETMDVGEIEELTSLLPNVDIKMIRSFLKQAKHASRKQGKGLREILAEKNIPINSIKSIILDAREKGEEDELLTYLEDPNVTLSDLRAKTKLSELFQEVQISAELKNEIMQLTDSRANVSMGPGEIPIAVFLKDGRINIDTKINGDVFIGDALIEIKMSNKSSGAQLANSAYSSRATKQAMFKTRAGEALKDKYGEALDISAKMPWPTLIVSVTDPMTNSEGKTLAMNFLNELYPGLFNSAEEVDWSSGEALNRSVGLALAMDYLKDYGSKKALMFIGLDRDTYEFIQTADEFKEAVQTGKLSFRMASDSVPRCNLTAGLSEE